MGIFSSKTEITAGVSVSHIVEDKPDVMRDSVLTTVMTGRPISDVILSNGVRGFASKVEKYFKFGVSDYSVGLPNGSSLVSGVNKSDVDDVVDQVAGEPATVFNLFFGTPRLEYLAFEHIQDTYGFTHSTKKFTNPPIPGSTREFFYVNAVINTAGTMIIEYYSSAPATPNETGYLTVVVPQYDGEGLYYNISYFLNSDVNQNLIFWVYRMKDNTYPILNITTYIDEETAYLPIITLRKDKENLTSNPYSEEYLTAEKMAYSIGLDIADITGHLLSEENGNDPNVIDSAFIVFGANIQSESKSTIKYLYQYFKHMAEQATTDKTKWNQWVDSGKTGDAPVNMIDIDDGRMRTTIFYNYIETEYLTGQIGNLGSLSRTTVLLPSEGEVEYSKVIFKKQISETGYEVLTIHGLKHVSHAYPGNIVIRRLEDSVKLNENLQPEGGFFIPVSRSVALKISAIDRSTLYLDSLAVVVYTVQITKVKWYQQKWFRIVLVIVAIVYALYTTDWSQVTSALAALKVGANVIINLILNSLLIEAFAKVAGMLGEDFAAIATTIAALYAVYSGALSGDSALPWAKDLLQVAMLSYQGIQKSFQDEFLNLQKDFQSFIEQEQETLKELKEMKDDLLQGVDLLYLMSPKFYFNPYESPSEFYERSVELKNPGILSFDALSSFYESKLTLPKLSASDIIKEYSEQNI